MIERNSVDFVDVFFHKQLFSTMVEFTNSNISDECLKVDEQEMCRFVEMTFAMPISPMSNIKYYWSIEDNGLIHVTR
jgi:hypothetical protein